MNNSDKFLEVFGIYAEEFWAKPEQEMLEWINGEIEQTAKVRPFHVIDKQTGKEADTWEIALNEDWAKHLCYCDMEGFAILEDGSLILTDECGRHGYCPEGRFEVVFDADVE